MHSNGCRIRFATRSLYRDAHRVCLCVCGRTRSTHDAALSKSVENRHRKYTLTDRLHVRHTKLVAAAAAVESYNKNANDLDYGNVLVHVACQSYWNLCKCAHLWDDLRFATEFAYFGFDELPSRNDLGECRWCRTAIKCSLANHYFCVSQRNSNAVSLRRQFDSLQLWNMKHLAHGACCP